MFYNSIRHQPWPAGAVPRRPSSSQQRPEEALTDGESSVRVYYNSEY